MTAFDRADALAVLAVLTVHAPTPALTARFRQFADGLPPVDPRPEPEPTPRAPYVPLVWESGTIRTVPASGPTLPQDATGGRAATRGHPDPYEPVTAPRNPATHQEETHA